MIRDFFRKHRLVKYAGLTLGLAVICTGVFFALQVSNVMGANESYIKEDTVQSMSQMVVTSEGSNLKGDQGSGAKPSSTEVPTAEGKKGSKTNPFVILEIVANKEDQQLAYLAQDEDSNDLLDVMKIGIDFAKKENRSFVPGSSAGIQQDHLKSLGQWFCNWEYSIFKIGASDTGAKETVNYTKTKKIYTVTVKEKDLKKMGIDADQFQSDYEDSKQQYYSRGGINMETFLGKNEKYKDLFETDDNDKTIRKIARDDSVNWKPEYESKVVQEEKSESFHENGKSGKGYLVAVEPGKGDFGFAGKEDASTWTFTRTGTDADRWVYVENESDIKEEYRKKKEDGKLKLYFGHYELHDGGKDVWWGSLEELYTEYATSELITGMYLDLSSNDSWNASCKYVTQPEVRENEYTFSYYGLAITTNILKRELFTFNDEQDYKDFNLEVIAMTPDEINELEKKDDTDTLDIIERADMFYIGGYTKETYERTKVHELYYKYVKGDSSFSESSLDLKTFAENDLDWSSSYKILYRLCNNKNLPMIMTQGLGKLLADCEQVPMYVSDIYPSLMRDSSICNILKLYIIGAEFDLTAKKAEDPTYVRTFYDDLLGQLKSAGFSDTLLKKNGTNGAQTTGYYERPILAWNKSTNQPADGAARCYYMWNALTFWPVELGDAFYNSDQIKTGEEDIERYVSYGYNRSFFDSKGSTPNKILTDPDQITRQDGSDGTKGNVGIPHNNGDLSYSTIIGNTESAHVTNTVLDVAYQIMNNRPEKVSSMDVRVLNQKKEYVKMDDTAVLLDYVQNQKHSYGSKQSYLKIQISDSNNGQPGLVTKVRLKNSSGDAETLTLYKSRDFTSSNECDKQTYKDSNSSATGYNVDSTLIAYVPYSLQKWAKGYDTVEVTTVGRIYSVKKKKFVQGSGVKTDISISERTLFNLE